jgi:hypothetical protein
LMCKLIFKITMSHNAKGGMRQATNVNLVTWMLLKIINSPILAHKPSEDMKVVKIAMVQVLRK